MKRKTGRKKQTYTASKALLRAGNMGRPSLARNFSRVGYQF